MSWFKRRPRTRDPIKTPPRDVSPLTEKLLEESKQAIRNTKPKKYKQHLIQNKLSVNNNKHFSTTTRKIITGARKCKG